MKFALYNYNGQPVKYYQSKVDTLSSDDQETTSLPSHLIIIVDCSGSMYRILSK